MSDKQDQKKKNGLNKGRQNEAMHTAEHLRHEHEQADKTGHAHDQGDARHQHQGHDFDKPPQSNPPS